MDRRSFLMEMRKAHQLKGDKPCFVVIKFSNNGKKYKGEYILSLRDDILYFQKINRLFEILRPVDDFNLNVFDFIGFKIKRLNRRNSLILYKENHALPHNTFTFKASLHLYPATL